MQKNAADAGRKDTAKGAARAQEEPSHKKGAAVLLTHAAESVESWGIGQPIVTRGRWQTPASWKQGHRSSQRHPGSTQANVQECSIRYHANKGHSGWEALKYDSGYSLGLFEAGREVHVTTLQS